MNFVIALAGNPNSGKTTLFNALTGSNQYVGNWPGVTVERKEARFAVNADTALLVDLPGVYSLSPYSLEERITRDFIARQRPDVIVNVVDATNLERGLYLTLQLMELRRPLVIALNLIDEVQRRGGHIDCPRLSRLLGAPVLPISARRRQGFDGLFAQLYHQAHHPICSDPARRYDEDTRSALRAIGAALDEAPQPAGGAGEAPPYEWIALKLLEGDREAWEVLRLPARARAAVEEVCARYVRRGEMRHPGIDAPTLVAEARYGAIERLLREAGVTRQGADWGAFSARVDRVVTSRAFAFPIFFAVMALMFAAAFGPLGESLTRGMEWLLGEAAAVLEQGLAALASPPWVRSLILEGVLAGVGGVLRFLPQILIIFLFLALLEDSGYMARAAFIADLPLKGLGLSGRSFIPMLMGFGCTTTAVIAARGVENERDRHLTILLTPFMSCGAKLPIYGLFCGALFPEHQAAVVFSLYLLGMLIMALLGIWLRKTRFREGESPFLLELPAYRLPTPSSVLRNLWERAKDFMTRAGSVIFAMSVLIWVLQHISFSLAPVPNSRDSIFGQIGSALAWAFAPLGFGTWEKSVALLSGLIAKEAVVSTLQIVYGAGAPGALGAVIARQFTQLSAYSFLTFTLLYTPCVSALAAMRRELGSGKKALQIAALQLLIAYAASLCIYQLGRLAGWS